MLIQLDYSVYQMQIPRRFNWNYDVQWGWGKVREGNLIGNRNGKRNCGNLLSV